jgi:hypothetical protein
MIVATIKSGTGSDEESDWMEAVLQPFGSLLYGVRQIVGHDSQEPQIETTERMRLASCRENDLTNQQPGGTKPGTKAQLTRPSEALPTKQPK